MLNQLNPTELPAWQLLNDHFEAIKNIPLHAHFAADAERFKAFSLHNDGFLFDFSKNHISQETMQLFKQLFNACGVDEARDAMFGGSAINATENRAVLHTALRNTGTSPVLVEGRDVMPDIREVLLQMEQFSEEVREGRWKGFTGKRIKNIVNIGIGGSDLGPKMVAEALKPYQAEHLQFFFE